MTHVFSTVAVFISLFSYVFGVRPASGQFLSRSNISAAGTFYSGERECGDQCIARAIAVAVQNAKLKCASEVEAISQWSIFHGIDRREGYGASAMAEFKCIPTRVAAK